MDQAVGEGEGAGEESGGLVLHLIFIVRRACGGSTEFGGGRSGCDPRLTVGLPSVVGRISAPANRTGSQISGWPRLDRFLRHRQMRDDAVGNLFRIATFLAHVQSRPAFRFVVLMVPEATTR
jgi:hypothetical protein